MIRDVVRAEDELFDRMRHALGLPPDDRVTISGPATLDSAYPVSDLAAASVAAAAAATNALDEALGFPRLSTSVNRTLVDGWFAGAVRPVGWELPPAWDSVAGDYRTADGWIRLHTNAPHHRAAALRVLGVDGDRAAVAAIVAAWAASDLQEAIVAAGGCAAELLAPAAWAVHPQGLAVAGTPLVTTAPTGDSESSRSWQPRPDRPLAGLRVLDLTRVLAGPTATRLLAGLGADVLRIDPPTWAEPALEPETTLGKRCARVDARTPAGREILRDLLAEADVLVHGYRGGALDALGLDADARDALRPGLVDVSLTAYGPTGPWAARRGFDSLVQMSTGIAAAGLLAGTADRPTPLPVQALDHATGYLMAAAVLAALADRVRIGRGTRAVLSLARTALELERVREADRAAGGDPAPVATQRTDTVWGPVNVLDPPITFSGRSLSWDRPPSPLGSTDPRW